jgi:hypothetical protein
MPVVVTSPSAAQVVKAALVVSAVAVPTAPPVVTASAPSAAVNQRMAQ